jgi:hypothetical protein
MQVSTWLQNAKKIPGNNTKYQKAERTFSAVLRLLHGSNWSGACHASSAITHILLAEQQIPSQLVIGEAKLDDVHFDHSWVEIDGKPIDAAISLPLIPIFWAPPVFLGKELLALGETKVIYRASADGFDEDAAAIAANDLGWYMPNFPDHPQGLWGMTKMVGLELGVRLNVAKLRQDHSSRVWSHKT